MSFKIPNVQPFASRPPGFYCYICGKEYGSASLRIHFKSCIKQWEAVENQKPKNLRRPIPIPPPELQTIYEMMRRGVKIDPKIIDFYNEKAIRLWEERFCMKCSGCGRMIPHSQKDSHKKLCIHIPQIDAPTESIQEAIIKDFPYEPKANQIRLPSQRLNTESTDYSTANESLSKSTLNKPSIENYNMSPNMKEEINLVACEYCARQYIPERIEKHKSACESQLRGLWKHDEMVKRAQSKQLENLKFHDFEKQYKTHKWKDQHEEIFSIFADPISRPKSPKKFDFELVNNDFVECDSCHHQFHPKRLLPHNESCEKKSHNTADEEVLHMTQPTKLSILSKGIKRAENESIKALNSPLKLNEPTKKKTPIIKYNLPQSGIKRSKNKHKEEEKLLPKKPDIIKIKLREVYTKIDNLSELDKAITAPVDIKQKMLYHIKNPRNAGPDFESQSQTAYLRVSDFAKN